jgi:hypothetical protein
MAGPSNNSSGVPGTDGPEGELSGVVPKNSPSGP